MPRTTHLLISGIVQGVGYRWWTTRTAKALGLHGWVRNLRDGRVEVLAHGAEAGIEALVKACAVGPSGAVVEHVRSAERSETPDLGFHQVSTASDPLDSQP